MSAILDRSSLYATTPRPCPLCGAPLQRLSPLDGDGWGVEITVDETSRRIIVERPVVAIVYACPRCEFCV